MAETTWNVQLPNVPDDYGPSAIPSLIAAVNELRQAIASGSTPATTTPATLAGYDAGTSNGKLVQTSADGSGFTFTAPAAAPTADTLTGATAFGRSLMKAADAAAVRTLLNVAEKPAA